MSSELKTNKISPATGTAFTLGDSGDTFTVPSGTTLDIASGATLTNSGTATGFGKVLQVVSSSYNGSDSTTSTTFVDTGLTANITPSSTSNKVLILCDFTMGFGTDGRPGYCIKRGSTELNLGVTTSIGNRKAVTTAAYSSGNTMLASGAISYLDSPSSTSSVTYTLAMLSRDTSYSAWLNYTGYDGNDASYVYRGASTITLMEIAG